MPDLYEEILDNKNLDNAYRFDRKHLIMPVFDNREEDQEDGPLPFGMRIQTLFTLNPTSNAC
jgi:hypothetical protein